MVVNMKFCIKCQTNKPLTDYWKNKAAKDGLQSYCKPCWYARTSERRNGPNREIELRQRKNRHLVREYGITIDEYEARLAEQHGECAICFSKLSGTNKYGAKKLAVDHDHATGKVRGLLCENCNRGLGNFYDNTDYLTNAIRYLKVSSLVVIVMGSSAGSKRNLKGAGMAKHITKAVIEDIAYELKTAGLWVIKAKTDPEGIKDFDIAMDLTNPEDVLDDLIQQLGDTLAEHDPSFDRQKFMEQTSYKVEM